RTMPSTLPARTKLRDAAPVAGLTIGPWNVFSSATTSNSSAAYRAALAFVIQPVRAESADEIQHAPEVAALVPQFKALVYAGTEMEIPITLQTDQVLEVAPVHRL